MTKSKISIIAALGAKTKAIGKAGGLLWKIPGDLPRFKKLTLGHPIILGRKTYESIGKPLLGRTNIIITRNPDFVALGGRVTKSLDEALEIARSAEGSEEIFIIGGGEIYSQALPLADRLYLTLVNDDAPGNVFFPDYSAYTHVITEEPGMGLPPHKFLILER